MRVKRDFREKMFALIFREFAKIDCDRRKSI